MNDFMPTQYTRVPTGRGDNNIKIFEKVILKQAKLLFTQQLIVLIVSETEILKINACIPQLALENHPSSIGISSFQ
jgi:hypothetical protein